MEVDLTYLYRIPLWPVTRRDSVVEECKITLTELTRFSENEAVFLNKILDEGRIEPAYLTDDKELQEKISNHPGLLWKALNIRNHKNKIKF